MTYNSNQPLTLRQLLNKLKDRDGDDFEKTLDLPLCILVKDDHTNMEIVDVLEQWPATRRPDFTHGSQYHGELRLTVYLDDKRMVKNK